MDINPNLNTYRCWWSRKFANIDIKDRFINLKEETKNFEYFLTEIIQTINKGKKIYIDKVKNRTEIKLTVPILPSDNIDAKRPEFDKNGN